MQVQFCFGPILWEWWYKFCFLWIYCKLEQGRLSLVLCIAQVQLTDTASHFWCVSVVSMIHEGHTVPEIVQHKQDLCFLSFFNNQPRGLRQLHNLSWKIALVSANKPGSNWGAKQDLCCLISCPSMFQCIWKKETCCNY